MLSVEHLTTRYGPIEAVRDVSIHVNEGEIVGVLGPTAPASPPYWDPSWAWSVPSQGKVFFMGRTSPAPNPRPWSGSAWASSRKAAGCSSSLTVSDNLRLGAATRKDKAAAKSDLDAMFELFPVLKAARTIWPACSRAARPSSWPSRGPS